MREQETIVKQENPPTSTIVRHNVDWDAVVKEAKSKPGAWFNIGPFSPGIAHHIRIGGYKQFLNPDDPTPGQPQMRRNWEITTRTVSTIPRRADIYVRYIGK